MGDAGPNPDAPNAAVNPTPANDSPVAPPSVVPSSAPDASASDPRAPASNIAPAGTSGAVPTESPQQQAASVSVAAGDDTPGDRAGKKGKKKKGKKGKKGKNTQQADDVLATRAAADTDESTDDNALVGDSVEGDPWGNTKGLLRTNGLMFRFLIQAQYSQTFGADSHNPDTNYRTDEDTLARSDDGWDISRVFFGINAEPSKYLRLKVLTDFAEFRKSKTSRAVKQAYVELRPMPRHLHFAAGILKLPFSIHELDSIATYEFTSSGRANALLNNLDFAGRDIGAEVIVSPLAKPRYLKLTLGAYRGHAYEENASPVGTIGTRVETEAIRGLRFGGGALVQPKDVIYRNPLATSGDNLLPTPDYPDYPRAETWKKGYALGLDVTYRHQGFVIRGEGLIGTRVDYDTRYGADKWVATWGIVAYKFDADLVKLEPAVRVEYLDTNFGHAGGLYRLYTAGVGVHFSAFTKLLFDVTRMEVEPHTPYISQPLPLREVPYNALDATCVTARLQVAL